VQTVHRNRLTLAAFAVCAIAAIVAERWLRSGSNRGGGAGPDGEPAAQDHESDAVQQSSELPGAQSAAETRAAGAADSGSRVPADPGLVLRGRVRREDGVGLAGAVVRWSTTRAGEPKRTWSELPWASMDGQTSTVTSGVGGSFTLALPVRSAAGSCVWASMPGFAAEALLFDEAAPPGELTLDLRSAAPIGVRVVAADGSPAAGAVVNHYGAAFANVDLLLAGTRAAAIEVYHVQSRADDQGEVSLAWVPGNTIVQAESGGLRSWPIYVEDPGVSLELRLRSTCFVEGVVSPPPGGGTEIPARVNMAAAPEPEGGWMGGVSVRDDGGFGPIEIPVVPGAEYLFVLAGDRYETLRITRRTPRPGERVYVEFDARMGIDVVVTTVDPKSEPICGAYVRARWTEAETGTEFASMASFTDEDGSTVLHGCAREGVWFDASANGYVSATRNPVAFRSFDPAAVTIELVPSGRIEGLVTRAGVPVPSFDLIGWTSDIRRPSSWHFESEDGTFTLEGVPAVDTHLVATSSECPRSPPALAEFDEYNLAEVELTLAAPFTGAGVVIEANARTPVEAAQVQAYTNHGITPMAPWGAPASTDHEGRFELAAFPPGLGAIWVTAEGFQGSMGFARAEHGDALDFGVIPLFRETSIAVQLVSAEPRDFTTYRLAAHDGVVQDPTPFPASGCLELGRATATRYVFEIIHPGGYSDVFEHHQRPGDPWIVNYEIAGGISLEVSPGGAAGCDFEGAWQVEVVHRTADGRIARLLDWSDGPGPCVVTGLEPGPIMVTAGDVNSGPSGVARSILDFRPEQRVDVELECGRRTLRLEDHRGIAISGSALELWDEDESPRRAWWTTTDTAGGFEVPASAGPLLRMCARGELTMLGIAVELEQPAPAVQVIRLPPPEQARVKLLDGATPLGGIACWITESVSGQILNRRYTDSDGVATWEDVAPATYEVVIGEQRLWRTSATVRSALEHGEPTCIQVRRLGSLAVSVTASGGAPVAGVVVELTSAEFQVDVLDWIEAGRAAAPGGQLATDEDGRLVVEGIPHGEYRWQVTAPTGERRDGVLTVPPAKQGALAVSLP
jgi:hypothetical protein